MLRINSETDIVNARRNFEASMNAVNISELTFSSSVTQYGNAKLNLEKSRKELEKGYEEAKHRAVKQAIFGFVKGISEVLAGVITKNPSAIGT